MNTAFSQPRRVFVAMALLSALLVTGCSGEPERGPVTGVVTLDGKPLPQVMVVFVPDPEHGTPGQRSVAMTDKDGRYVIHTDKDQEGASVGVHRVSLYDPLAFPVPEGGLSGLFPGKATDVPKEPKPTPSSRVPAKYTDVSKTPLQPVTIGREAQTYDIALTSK
jgi:hypothetical protein